MWAKDLCRAIDYAETHSDLATDRLAYYGVSWGGAMGGLMPAVEPRIKVSVLIVAGLAFERVRPEVDPFNFLPRITTATLMLNGRYDFFFPLETAQRLPAAQHAGGPEALGGRGGEPLRAPYAPDPGDARLARPLPAPAAHPSRPGVLTGEHRRESEGGLTKSSPVFNDARGRVFPGRVGPGAASRVERMMATITGLPRPD
jgi:hypothetical protein